MPLHKEAAHVEGHLPLQLLPTAPPGMTVLEQPAAAVVTVAALPKDPTALAASLLATLHRDTSCPELPIKAHDDRLGSGRRGVSLDFLRGVRAFFGEHVACSTTRWSSPARRRAARRACAPSPVVGWPLARRELRDHVRAAEADVSLFVGAATTFFSYSWTGTKLADMLYAIIRQVEALEKEDGKRRYVWIDMFCACQNLLANVFLPSDRRSARRSRPLTERDEYGQLPGADGQAV